MITQSTPIAGVSTAKEAVVMVTYPTIASTEVGKALGLLYDCVPLKIWGIKVSNLLFALPTIPIALLIFALLKLFGSVYVLTNRSVQLRSSLGNWLLKSIPLTSIAAVEAVQHPSQVFFPAGDLTLRAADGEPLLQLGGVSRHDIFKVTIDKAIQARKQVEASLKTIAARA